MSPARKLAEPVGFHTPWRRLSKPYGSMAGLREWVRWMYEGGELASERGVAVGVLDRQPNLGECPAPDLRPHAEAEASLLAWRMWRPCGAHPKNDLASG